MSGSVSGLNSFANIRSAMTGPSALEGLARGQEANLTSQEAAAERSLPVSKDGNRTLAQG
jgi:hypothetical protein